MMESRIWVLIAGLAIGGLGAMALMRPEPPEPPEIPEERFIVVQNQDAYAIFEVDEGGILEAETGHLPDMAATWALMRDYQPMVLSIGSQEVVYLPKVKFSADDKDFQVTHRFYRYVEDKLMEVDVKPIAGE